MVQGGPLHTQVAATADLPWRVVQPIVVDSGGDLRPQAGARLVFDPGTNVSARNGGRILARGALADPAVFTADDPALGWAGISLDAGTAVISYLANVRIEHVDVGSTAVAASGLHTVSIDTAVFRQVGQAASLLSPGSRLASVRVDTTLAAGMAAVVLGADAKIANTLIRAASGDGLVLASAAAQVISCEIRGSVGHAIVLYTAAPVRNCNLVGNLGLGIYNGGASTAIAENNWWGDAAGPTGPSGDGAFGPLDYTPWRTAPYVLQYVP